MGRGDSVEGAKVYRDQLERDRELEGRYKPLWCNGTTEPWQDKPCCQSLLQHCSTHTEFLIGEYMQWVHDSHAPHAFDVETLHRWEVERFGDRAYAAAHALLLFAVKESVFGPSYKNLRKPSAEPKVKPGLSDEQRKGKMLTALSKVADAHTMPTRDDLAIKR